MKTVSLQELDLRTSDWLREASLHEQVLVTDRGTPLMSMTITPAPLVAKTGGSLHTRVLLPEFAAIMEGLGRGGTDSTQMISEERDRELA